ncbi:hypothetical protein Rhe02_60180 [Rhizocola hellebori]|uniref:Methylamine utilisation protein MauE domain-containing protein n=1 Tax=Rhizocola hellebori TaxID=1392758 RepID=A0A8J3QCA6_9ACTN|nr:MauE/DoxX family redox-associated membrane protein [Rhizocola hellebori]GIH07951.1 hypothetical protein Rhe02_60180 [Rhizocola hellebori]
MTALLVFTQWLIGATFLLSALSKVGSATSLRLFAETLVQLRLFRAGRPSRVAAAAIGLVEALVAIVLVPLSTAVTRLGFLLAIGLLAAFSAVILRSLRRREQVACRCFGGSAPAAFSAVHLVRNTGLLAAAVTGALAAGQPSAPWEVWVIAALAGAICAFIISRLDDVVSLFKTA